ncbi:hypothetical protein DFJ74DRAFT_201768 [Hyaloraphidium curvatum]|nr:hypothetical protein DFJ74DRAFT_201768 [Hyaloraphidium curvatum]
MGELGMDHTTAASGLDSALGASAGPLSKLDTSSPFASHASICDHSVQRTSANQAMQGVVPPARTIPKKPLKMQGSGQFSKTGEPLSLPIRGRAYSTPIPRAQKKGKKAAPSATALTTMAKSSRTIGTDLGRGREMKNSTRRANACPQSPDVRPRPAASAPVAESQSGTGCARSSPLATSPCTATESKTYVRPTVTKMVTARSPASVAGNHHTLTGSGLVAYKG